MARFRSFLVLLGCAGATPFIWQHRQMFSAPVINDVSTNLEDPPQYRNPDIGTLPETFKPKIRAHYPNVKPLRLQNSASEVFSAALKLAQEMPWWTIGAHDSDMGTIQGVATTRIMRFKDDWVIRVKPAGSQGSVVDMRSRSRVGKGDMGTNAFRIEDFLHRLAAAVAQSQ